MPKRVHIVLPEVLADDLRKAFNDDTDLLVGLEFHDGRQIDLAIKAFIDRGPLTKPQLYATAAWVEFAEAFERLNEQETEPAHA